MRMMHAVSARAPVRPLRKYEPKKSHCSDSPGGASFGAMPKRAVVADVHISPMATARRVPMTRMMGGATRLVSAMPSG